MCNKYYSPTPVGQLSIPPLVGGTQLDLLWYKYYCKIVYYKYNSVLYSWYRLLSLYDLHNLYLMKF